MINTILLIEWLLVIYKPNFFDPVPQNQIKDDTLKIIEKVYLHTDRNYYYSGEDIWFKAYLIDASNNLITNHSNNLHIDLISPKTKITDSHIIRIENGLGNGDFSIPKDLASGQYKLRAYTNYMRNFGDQIFFYKDISIINPLDPNDKQADSIKYIENKINIGFFPEGGSLVDNVSSIVAFKAVDALGKGCDVSGEIYSSDGKLITSFRSVHQGMGSFVLKPLSGRRYSAIVKNTSGDRINTELPRSFSTGVTQSIIKDESNNLMLAIKTNPQTFQLIRDKDLSLNISARNVPLKTIIFRIKSLYNKISIPLNDLPDGIIMLTLSSVYQQLPLCERLIFLQNNNNINLQIETNKMTFKQRDSVALKITLRGDSTTSDKAFLSLSAADNISSNSSYQFPSTISSWFLLESDVRGPIEDPSYYFDSSNPNRIKDLDLLLLTQGWRDFEWKYKSMSYPPEQGFTISGRLKKLIFDRPIPGSKVNIGLFGTENTLITSLPTDSLGRFSLPGVDFIGDVMIVASPVNEKEKLSGEIILDSLKYVPSEIENNFPAYRLQINENIASFKNDLLTKSRIRKKFKLSDTIELEEVKVIAKKTDSSDPQSIKIKNDRVMYGFPDNEVIITPGMESYSNALAVIRGRIPGVEIFGGGREIKIIIRGMGSINGGSSPLFLLDGVTSSIEEILTLPVSWIDRIDILKTASNTAIFGMRGGNGVIAVITRTANRFTNGNTESHSVRLKMSGYDAPRVFYSPHHTARSSSIYNPDLRTTLFWDPNITLEYNKSITLNYFNADYSSTIKITLEGITTSGIPVSTKAIYKVD
jgi:TonB-dependent SusC/RagA subfamily outer membrane receptor